jgi:heptosyltransferase-1
MKTPRKILIIKMSSMGDILHTLPAIQDACQHYPQLQFDWVVEEAFVEIPQWHTNVNMVIPIAWRRWRKQLWRKKTWAEMKLFWQQLRQTQYDLIIDAQGLIKSAMVSRCAKGLRLGFDWHSARESWATLFYQQKISVSKHQHAVARLRELFAKALDYSYDPKTFAYGVEVKASVEPLPQDFYLFIPNTTWATKLWPIEHWRGLIAALAPHPILIPCGYAHELPYIEKIANGYPHVRILPHMQLSQLRDVIANARLAVSVDTGLSHLCAALETPTIVLYGATDPKKIGTLGNHQIHLQVNFPCAPCHSKTCTFTKLSAVKPACYTTLTPTQVLNALTTLQRATHHDQH